MRVTIFLILLGFLSGCGSTHSIYKLSDIPEDQLGYLTGTIGAKFKGGDRSRDVWHEITISDVQRQKVATVQYQFSRPWMGDIQYVKNDYIDKIRNQKGIAFSIPLPAGQYYLSKTKFWTDRSTYTGAIYIDNYKENSENTRELFSVEANRATYMGSLVAKSFSAPFFAQTNKLERDKKLLTEKFPELIAYEFDYVGPFKNSEPYIRNSDW